MPENPNLHTRDIHLTVPGCEALGPNPTNEEIFDLHRVVGPGDPFAPQYLRDAAARLGTRQAVVVQWPDGVAAILSGEHSREAVINAYWQSVNRFMRSYIEVEMPKYVGEAATQQPRQKRRYTKRKGTAKTPVTGPEQSANEK